MCSYTWHPELDRILGAELARAPRAAPELRARWIDAAETPLTEGHRMLLYDHLAALRDLAATDGRQVSIARADAAARALT
jgi:hypothetical protein